MALEESFSDKIIQISFYKPNSLFLYLVYHPLNTWLTNLPGSLIQDLASHAPNLNYVALSTNYLASLVKCS